MCVIQTFKPRMLNQIITLNKITTNHLQMSHLKDILTWTPKLLMRLRTKTTTTKTTNQSNQHLTIKILRFNHRMRVRRMSTMNMKKIPGTTHLVVLTKIIILRAIMLVSKILAGKPWVWFWRCCCRWSYLASSIIITRKVNTTTTSWKRRSFMKEVFPLCHQSVVLKVTTFLFVGP